MIALCFHTFAFALFPFVSPPFLPHTFSLFSCLLYFCSIPARLPAFNDRNRTSPIRRTKSILYTLFHRYVSHRSRQQPTRWACIHCIIQPNWIWKTLESLLDDVSFRIFPRFFLSRILIIHTNYFVPSSLLFSKHLSLSFERGISDSRYQHQNCFLPLASDILFCITIPARK